MIFLAHDKKQWNPKYKSFYYWKLNFITLTLCEKQRHSDKYTKEKMLQPFLDWCRKNYKTENYFWRAESQKNGRIHFHICFDVFIPWQLIVMKWNHIQANNGYTSFNDKLYKRGSANGTDVHSLKKVKNVAKYLSKYCGKNSKGITILLQQTKKFNSQKKWCFGDKFIQPIKDAIFFRPIYGRLWSSSENLSKYKTCKVPLTYEMKGEIAMLESKKILDYFNFDFVTIYKCSIEKLLYNGLQAFHYAVYSHLDNIINSS